MERVEIIGSYNYKLLIGSGWREKHRESVNGKNVAIMIKGISQGGK